MIYKLFIIFFIFFKVSFADFDLVFQKPIHFFEDEKWVYLCDREKCKINLNLLNLDKDISKKINCKVYIWTNNIISDKCNPPSIEINNDENILKFYIYDGDNLLWSRELVLIKKQDKKKLWENDNSLNYYSTWDFIEKKDDLVKKDYKNTLKYKLTKLKSWLKITWNSSYFNNIIIYFSDKKKNLITDKSWNFNILISNLDASIKYFDFYWLSSNSLEETFIKRAKTEITSAYLNDINLFYSKKKSSNSKLKESKEDSKLEKQDIKEKKILLDFNKDNKSTIKNENKEKKIDFHFYIIFYFVFFILFISLIFFLLYKKKLI